MSSPLPQSFYERPAETVARDLLGAILVRRIGDSVLRGRIVEAEAYLFGNDEAAHSHAGLTNRTRVIFGPPGRAYVYLIYGVHCCLNLVAEPDGRPGCVLIRALEPLDGLDEMRRRRPRARRDRELASGPGRLCQAFDIDLSLYGADVTAAGGALSVHPPLSPEAFEVAVTPRVGISRAVDLPLRFYIRDNEHVSRK